MMKSSEYFYCYTKKLSLFLGSQGINYIIKAKSVKDNSIFVLYEKSNELQWALEQSNIKNHTLEVALSNFFLNSKNKSHRRIII